MKEKEAKAHYEIISKLSFSEVVELITRGCDNPINSRNLEQGDTIAYAGGFGIGPIERVVTAITDATRLDLTRLSQSLSCFIVRKIIELPVREQYGESERKEIKYWMYRIRFVGDALFKELYREEGLIDELPEEGALGLHLVRKRRDMLDNLDRPTIVFNVKTGDKWICDWMHPKLAFRNRIISPPLKFHDGSGSVFDKSQIVILNPIILNHYFLNWNKENPWEVKR